jgi:hypothetical protein
MKPIPPSPLSLCPSDYFIHSIFVHFRSFVLFLEREKYFYIKKAHHVGVSV